MGLDLGSILSGAASGGATGGPLGAAIGAGGGLLGSLFGGSGLASDTTKAVQKNVPGLLQKGNQFLGDASQNLGGAANFYKTILGGDRNAIMQLLSPQVSTVLSQYDNAANAVRQFAPRGGGATATLAAIPFQKAGVAGSAFQSVLPGAAAGLAGVGGQQGGLGLGATSAAMGGGELGLQLQKLREEQMGTAGKGFGQILAQLLNNKGGKGGGGTGTIPGWDTTGLG